MKPTYHLKDWKLLGDILTGIIQEDHQVNPHLCAGNRVYTSRIISRDGNKFETMNSFYTVEGD